MVAVVGIANTFEGALQRECGHGECSALGCGVALIHILYAACLGACARGIEVNLKVLHRLKGHLDLQVLGRAGGGWRCHRVVHEQPVVFPCLFYVGVTR